MPTNLVTRQLFEGWRQKVVADFHESRIRLEKAESGLARRMLIKNRGGQNIEIGDPAYACSAAMEAIDVKMSDGHFLTQVKVVKKKKRYYGRETARRIIVQKYHPAEWRGGEQFHRLFQKILRQFIAREMKRSIYGDVEVDLPDLDPTKLEMQLSRDTVVELVADVTMIAQLFGERRQARLADVANAMILFIKKIVYEGSDDYLLNHLVNPGNLDKKELNQFTKIQTTSAEEIPLLTVREALNYFDRSRFENSREIDRFTDELIDLEILQKKIGELSVEKLFEYANTNSIIYRESELWRFVQRALDLTDASLYQRKRQFCVQLARIEFGLPERFEYLVNLWKAHEAVTAIAACEERIDLLKNEDSRETLLALRDYLKWYVASQYPKFAPKSDDFYQLELSEICDLPPSQLIDRRLGLPEWSIGVGGFREFVCSYSYFIDDLHPRLKSLLSDLESLKPKPSKLVGLIKEFLDDRHSSEEISDE